MTGYLLSLEHPSGRYKARVFQSFGFRLGNRAALRDALLAHAREANLIATEETEFGRKFVVEGPLRALDGRNPLIRSIWFEEDELGPVRLVTAYPSGERR